MKILISLLVLLISLNFETALAVTPDEMRKAIEEKASELKEINTQIQGTQSALENLGAQKQSLSKEIKKLDYNINQLNLNIRGSEINIQKTKLELDLLGDKKSAVEDNISAKKKAITDVLREIQQNDEEDIVQILFKNSTLADSFSEIQNLQNLRNGLSDSAAELAAFRAELNQTIDQTTKAKNKIETENKNLKNRKFIVDDQKQEKNNTLKLTKNQESLYQKQLNALEDKQAEISKVIDDLEQKLRASIDLNILPVKRPGVFEHPVQKPIITQEYGATEFAQSAYKSKFHNGVDFGVPVGTPLFAADDGEVIAVDNNDNGNSRWQRYQYGKYVLIKHSNNLATLYAHLSRQIVKVGDIVKRGDIIGYSGNTGYSTGPHLHFGVYWMPSILFRSIPPAAGLVPIGVTINPLDYL